MDEDDPVVEEIVERIEKLERENRELRQKLENQQSSNSRTGTRPSSQAGSDGISRRKFLKMLGMGAGGLALSSSAAGLTWSKITPQSQGTSDIQAETATKGVTNGSPFNIEDTSTGNNLFSASEGGPINIQNADLNLNQNNIDNVQSLSIMDELTDPSGKTHTEELLSVPDLTNHASNSNAHHTRYRDDEALNAIVYTPRWLHIYDTFERGLFHWHMIGNAGGGIQTSTKSLYGSQGLKVSVSGTGDNTSAVTHRKWNTGNVEIWAAFRHENNSKVRVGMCDDSVNSTAGMYMDYSGGNLVAQGNDSNRATSQLNLSKGTWYISHIKIDYRNNKVYVEVMDKSQSTLESVSYSGYIEGGSYLELGTDATGGNTHTSYFDGVAIHT